MTTVLSPEEVVAQSLLLLHGQSSLIALATQSAIYAAISDMEDNNPNPTAEDYTAAANSALQNAGHLTDVATLASQSDYLQSSHAGIWSGEYTLLDDNGGIHKLYIDSDTISLQLNGRDELVSVPSEGGESYSNGAISVDNDKATLALKIQSPMDGVNFDDATIDIAQYFDRCEPTVVGSLLIKGQPNQTLALKGKRGVQTPGGVLSELDGEPAWCWGGEYRMRYTDSDSWEWSADNLLLDIDANTGRFAMRIGKLVASAFSYGKHCFFGSISFSKGIDTQFLLAMSCGLDGSRKFYAWFDTSGQIRTATGYCTSKLSEQALWGRPASIDNLPNAPAPKAISRSALGALNPPTFCAAKHDKLFSASRFVSNDAAAPTVASLFGSDGFSVDAASIPGSGANLSNLVFKVATASVEKANIKVASGTRLIHFQLPGADNRGQVGEGHCKLGMLLPVVCNFIGVVGSTGQSYATRLSLTDFATVSADGFDLSLAVDDEGHRAFQLVYPTAATCTGDDSGVSPAVSTAVPDFTKASVLLFGEVTPEGHSARYYLMATPKSDAAKITVDVTPTYSDSTTAAVSSQTLPCIIEVQVNSAAATSSKATDFFASPYDTVVFASSMIAPAGDPDAQTPSSLFTTEGYRVDFHDSAGKLESYAVFTVAASETGSFASSATLRSYQKIDEVTNVPLEGADNCLVGVLIGQKYSMPILVETDSYDVRFSISGYEKINPDGLTIELAEDDAHQATLLGLAQPLATDVASTYPANDPWGRGPDANMTTKIADYTKASVLVQGTTGETEIVGMKNYLFAVTPKTDKGYSIQASRQIYDATGTAVGSPVELNVPILLHIAIQMDSRDQIVLSGTDWPPMVRDKTYNHQMAASYGQAPLVWRVLQDGGLGDGATTEAGPTWTGGAIPGTDYSGASFGLNGLLLAKAFVGRVYGPVIRVMNDRSVVMKPTIVSPSIMLTEPDTQGRAVEDQATFVAELIGGIGMLASFGYFLFRHLKKEEPIKSDTEVQFERIQKLVADHLKLGGFSQDLGVQALGDIKANAVKIRDNADLRLQTLKNERSSLREAIAASTKLLEAKQTEDPSDERDAAIDEFEKSIQEMKDKITEKYAETKRVNSERTVADNVDKAVK